MIPKEYLIGKVIVEQITNIKTPMEHTIHIFYFQNKYYAGLSHKEDYSDFLLIDPTTLLQCKNETIGWRIRSSSLSEKHWEKINAIVTAEAI